MCGARHGCSSADPILGQVLRDLRHKRDLVATAVKSDPQVWTGYQHLLLLFRDGLAYDKGGTGK